MVGAIEALQTTLQRYREVQLARSCWFYRANSHHRDLRGVTGLYAAQTGNTFLSSFPLRSQQTTCRKSTITQRQELYQRHILFGNYTSTGEDHGFVNKAFTGRRAVALVYGSRKLGLYTQLQRGNEMRFGYDRGISAFSTSTGLSLRRQGLSAQ